MTSIRTWDDAAGLVVDVIDELLGIASNAAQQLEHHDRPDDATRVRDSIAATATGQIRVPIVGEFKSGKSSLVNALLGHRVVATNPLDSGSVATEVRHGLQLAHFADLETTGGVEHVRIDAEQFEAASSMTSPTIGGDPVRAFRATFPSPLLESGLCLIDTPSMSGGIASATASAVIAELMQSHAWILTTDVTQELTAPELELVKIGASLCPILIVVATKCDMTVAWKEIVEINRRHLGTLDLPIAPTIVPVALPLRAASIRLSDPALDRESGVPLLIWQLSRRTMVTARRQGAIGSAELIVDRMDDLDRAATDELETIAASGDRADILERSNRARERCERLVGSTRPAVERAVAEFRKRTRRDLEDRIDVVRRDMLDDLKQLRHERDWPKMEQRAQADVNRLLVDHLTAITKEVERVAEHIAAELELEPDELKLLDRLVLPSESAASLTGQIDAPSMPRSAASRMQALVMPARVGITGASGVGVGISSGILAGATAVVGIALVPLAAVGAGWWLHKRGRERDAVPWKHQAATELNRFLTDCHQLIGRCSEDVRDEVLSQLPGLLEHELRTMAQYLASEHDRLEALAKDRANMSRAQEEAIESRRSAVRLVASHARREIHRLNSPPLEAVLESAEPAAAAAALSDP